MNREDQTFLKCEVKAQSLHQELPLRGNLFVIEKNIAIALMTTGMILKA